jgi:type VI secretion system protein ImpF
MAHFDPTIGLMPSIVDRLIDPEAAGTDVRRGYGLPQMLEVIRRDLEDLLNTRQTHSGLDPSFTHLQNSIFAYGLPDLVTLNAMTTQQKEEIAVRIENVIARFEPRLRDVRVFLVDAEEKSRLSIACRIEGKLAVDPSPDVMFDTILETTTGQHKVVQKDT